jgi:hypothetical protein
VLIPSLQKVLAVLGDEAGQSVQFLCRKAAAASEADWRQPELRNRRVAHGICGGSPYSFE